MADKKKVRTIGGGIAIGIGTIALLGIGAYELFFKEKPVEKDPTQVGGDIGDVAGDTLKDQTGIEKVNYKIKENETLPYFIKVETDADGNSEYRVYLIGDYDQYVNVDLENDPDAAEKATDQRVIASIALTKEQVMGETGDFDQEKIRKAILDADKLDYTTIDYAINEEYENALAEYCSLLPEYENKIDWESAKIVQLDKNVSLSDVVRIINMDGKNYQCASLMFIDAEGNMANTYLRYDAYQNRLEQADQADILTGNAGEYTKDTFDGLQLMTEEEIALIGEQHNIVATGSYFEVKKESEIEKEPEETEDKTEEVVNTDNATYTFNKGEVIVGVRSR